MKLIRGGNTKIEWGKEVFQTMKQKAMDVKLVVRPLIGCLTHTHFWEGPCRAGRKEDMTVEAETKVADETFKSSVEALKDVISEVEFKEALDVRYNESFVVEKEMFDKIGEDVDDVRTFDGRSHRRA